LEKSIVYPRNYNLNIVDRNGDSPNDILKRNPMRKVLEERFNAKKLKKQYAYGVISLFDSYYQFSDFFQEGTFVYFELYLLISLVISFFSHFFIPFFKLFYERL
jgi:hypothetical protein